MSNYSAVVVTISNLRPHTNADRLVCTDIFGNNVIVGKDTKVGDKGLFFPLESQIGAEFAENNDLIRRKDENGKTAGGMFDNNRRVRAQTFRGEKSMGFWIPISSLDSFAQQGYCIGTEENEELEKIGDFVISQKYIPKTNGSGMGGGPKAGRKPRVSRVVPGQFHFHTDTSQLGRNLHKINPSDQIVITWKMHGTSSIVSNCLTNRRLSWYEKLLGSMGLKIEEQVYDYIYASRRVIKNEFEEAKEHFYGHDLWSDIGKEHFGGKLHNGETVYYEIVGFTKDGSPIQGGFDYGCEPSGAKMTVLSGDADTGHLEFNPHPQHKIFVYRITMTSSDGSVTELQWNQVKERCVEMDVSTVPEIYYGPVFVTFETMDENWRDGMLEELKRRFVHDQDSQFCTNSVPEEGVCVRKEGSVIETFKLKSFRFLEHETGQLDKGEVTIEEEN